MSDRRLVIASNRLPISAEIVESNIMLSAASGGLATGLRALHERSAAVWVGWPGTAAHLSSAQRRDLNAQLADRGIVPVHLTPEDVGEYYDQFSNGVLWPVFHYL